MSKFLEVHVARDMDGLLYLEVPDDFDPDNHSLSSIVLKNAAAETMDDMDWDESSGVYARSVREVSAEKAQQYACYSLLNVDPEDPS